MESIIAELLLFNFIKLNNRRPIDVIIFLFNSTLTFYNCVASRFWLLACCAKRLTAKNIFITNLLHIVVATTF